MAQYFLKTQDVATVHDEKTGEGVAENVRALTGG